jgi:hypothetical protein
MKVFLLIILLLPGCLFATDAMENHPDWDQEYTKKIREYTTGNEFITDLVDHLPSSDKVPSPLKFNGYIAGAADRLTYAADVHRYMRALESASPRVKVFSIGKSEEGREMILVAIADEETVRNLDRYKEITKKLSDPRKLNDADAASLIKTGKPLYHLTGAMHSVETGSPEMLMELAYRLVVEETPFIQSIRNNIITLITPVLEVDGRERMVDTVRWYQANPKSHLPPLVYWGKYVAHDNNRDAMGLALNLTRNIQNAYFEWHPQVIHDLHESIPFLYVSTGTGPYNPALDPIAIDEWNRMAYNEVQTLTQKGLIGVWTYGFYDGWAPNYMFWIAHGHNSIGRFYETYGNLVPSTQDRVVRGRSTREWYRPNPPYPKVKWSLRNNVNYQQSGVLLALKYMADNREHMLQTFWTLGKRSVAKAKSEGPAAYVFNADQKRLGQLRDLLNLLRSMGIEVHRSDQAFKIEPGWPPKKKEEGKKEEKEEAKKDKPSKEEKEASFAAGSFIIRMDQPYSRLADTLLDTQYVLGQERVYDDTGWTLGYTKNVDFKRIVNAEVLKVPMKVWDGKLKSNSVGNGKAIAIRNHADTDLIRLRYELPDAKFAVLQEEIKGKKGNLPAGTILIESTEAVRKSIASRATFEYQVLNSWPSQKTQEIPLRRIAILHTWLDTQDEGWYRLTLDDLKVPYDYISTQDVATITDLRSKYDVIIFPPVDAAPQDIVNGYPSGPKLPWKKSDLTPNLGVIDETEDMRPGMGFSGVQNIKKFVEDGGLLIAVRESATWAVHYGLAKYVSVVQPNNLKARGTLLRATVKDKNSPVIYGYDDQVPVHFAGSPIFRVGNPPRQPDKRLSGRGSATDPDVPQGRPFIDTPERPKPGPGEEGFEPPDDFAVYFEPYRPQIENRPRVILAFPKEADQLLLSGMLEGGDEIAGAPVVIDSPLGKGHILLFANNPMWRANTQGNYALVFNAIFNASNLSAGWPPAKE